MDNNLISIVGNGDSLPLQLGLIISILIFTIAYGAGFGAVPYALLGEIFTPNVKTIGVCVCQCFRLVHKVYRTFTVPIEM